MTQLVAAQVFHETTGKEQGKNGKSLHWVLDPNHEVCLKRATTEGGVTDPSKDHPVSHAQATVVYTYIPAHRSTYPSLHVHLYHIITLFLRTRYLKLLRKLEADDTIYRCTSAL